MNFERRSTHHSPDLQEEPEIEHHHELGFDLEAMVDDLVGPELEPAGHEGLGFDLEQLVDQLVGEDEEVGAFFELQATMEEIGSDDEAEPPFDMEAMVDRLVSDAPPPAGWSEEEPGPAFDLQAMVDGIVSDEPAHQEAPELGMAAQMQGMPALSRQPQAPVAAEQRTLQLRGQPYVFAVVATPAEADASHVTAAQLTQVQEIFTALDAELAHLTGEQILEGAARRGLRLGAATAEMAPGLKADTAVAQAHAFLDQLGKEMTRSASYRELIYTLVTGGGEPIELLFGKHSCGFFDNYADHAVDFDDAAVLPDDQLEQGTPEHARGTGLSRGELMMHVLEERYYMHRVDHEGYMPAHYKCMGPASHQTRYRAERGLEGRTVDLDVCNVSPDYSTGDFVTMDDQDNSTLLRAVPISKSGQDRQEYEQDPEDLQHERVDSVAVARQKTETAQILAAVQGLDVALEAQIRHWAGVALPDSETAGQEAVDAVGALQHRVQAEHRALRGLTDNRRDLANAHKKVADLAQYEDQDASQLSDVAPTVEPPEGYDEAEYAKYASRSGMHAMEEMRLRRKYGKYQKAKASAVSPKAKLVQQQQQLASNQQRIEDITQNNRVRLQLLDDREQGPVLAPHAHAPYLDTPVVAEIRGGYSDAIAMYETYRADRILGADPGSDAGNQYLRTQRQARPAGINDAAIHQFQENIGRHGGNQNCSLTAVGAVSGQKASEVATSFQTSKGATRDQLDPGMQTEEMWWRAEHDQDHDIDSRTPVHLTDGGPAQEHVGDAQWSGIQEALRDASHVTAEVATTGLPDIDQTRPAQELLDTLAAMPNGTQAVLWLCNDAYEGGHYVYAEVYDGHVVVEDYQFAREQTTHTQDRTAYVDKLPQKAVTNDLSFYTQGAMISCEFGAQAPAIDGPERGSSAASSQER